MRRCQRTALDSDARSSHRRAQGTHTSKMATASSMAAPSMRCSPHHPVEARFRSLRSATMATLMAAAALLRTPATARPRTPAEA